MFSNTLCQKTNFPWHTCNNLKSLQKQSYTEDLQLKYNLLKLLVQKVEFQLANWSTVLTEDAKLIYSTGSLTCFQTTSAVPHTNGNTRIIKLRIYISANVTDDSLECSRPNDSHFPRLHLMLIDFTASSFLCMENSRKTCIPDTY